MQNEPDEPRHKFIEIAADFLEPAIDTLVHSGILREIPLLGTAVKLAHASRSVGDRIFLVKIATFLRGLEAVEETEASEFARKLAEDPTAAERTGQTLLLLIDSLDDLEKARVLAVVFAAYLRGEVERRDFRRLGSAVGMAMVDDICALVDADVEGRASTEEEHLRRLGAMHALRTTGLTSLSDSAFAFTGKRSFISTGVTPLGQLLVGVLKRAGWRPA